MVPVLCVLVTTLFSITSLGSNQHAHTEFLPWPSANTMEFARDCHDHAANGGQCCTIPKQSSRTCLGMAPSDQGPWPFRL